MVSVWKREVQNKYPKESNIGAKLALEFSSKAKKLDRQTPTSSLVIFVEKFWHRCLLVLKNAISTIFWRLFTPLAGRLNGQITYTLQVSHDQVTALLKNGLREEAFSSYSSNSVCSDSYGDWSHLLASSFDGKMDMLTLEIFQDYLLKKITPWDYVLQFPDRITIRHTGRKRLLTSSYRPETSANFVIQAGNVC